MCKDPCKKKDPCNPCGGSNSLDALNVAISVGTVHLGGAGTDMNTVVSNIDDYLTWLTSQITNVDVSSSVDAYLADSLCEKISECDLTSGIDVCAELTNCVLPSVEEVINEDGSITYSYGEVSWVIYPPVSVSPIEQVNSDNSTTYTLGGISWTIYPTVTPEINCEVNEDGSTTYTYGDGGTLPTGNSGRGSTFGVFLASGTPIPTLVPVSVVLDYLEFDGTPTPINFEVYTGQQANLSELEGFLDVIRTKFAASGIGYTELRLSTEYREDAANFRFKLDIFGLVQPVDSVVFSTMLRYTYTYLNDGVEEFYSPNFGINALSSSAQDWDYETVVSLEPSPGCNTWTIPAPIIPLEIPEVTCTPNPDGTITYTYGDVIPVDNCWVGFIYPGQGNIEFTGIAISKLGISYFGIEGGAGVPVISSLVTNGVVDVANMDAAVQIIESFLTGQGFDFTNVNLSIGSYDTVHGYGIKIIVENLILPEGVNLQFITNYSYENLAGGVGDLNEIQSLIQDSVNCVPFTESFGGDVLPPCNQWVTSTPGSNWIGLTDDDLVTPGILTEEDVLNYINNTTGNPPRTDINIFYEDGTGGTPRDYWVFNGMYPIHVGKCNCCPTGGQALWYNDPLQVGQDAPILLVMNQSGENALSVEVTFTSSGGVLPPEPEYFLVDGGRNTHIPTNTLWATLPVQVVFDYGKGCTETIGVSAMRPFPATDVKDVQTNVTGLTLTLPTTPVYQSIVDVYKNGILLTEGVDYTLNIFATITFSTALVATDTVTTRYKTNG